MWLDFRAGKAKAGDWVELPAAPPGWVWKTVGVFRAGTRPEWLMGAQEEINIERPEDQIADLGAGFGGWPETSAFRLRADIGAGDVLRWVGYMERPAGRDSA